MVANLILKNSDTHRTVDIIAEIDGLYRPQQGYTFIAKSSGSVCHVPEVKGCFRGREANCQSRKSQQSKKHAAFSTHSSFNRRTWVENNLHLRLFSQHVEIEILTVLVLINVFCIHVHENRDYTNLNKKWIQWISSSSCFSKPSVEHNILRVMLPFQFIYRTQLCIKYILIWKAVTKRKKQ